MTFSPDELQALTEKIATSQQKARRRTAIAILVPTIAAFLYLGLTAFTIYRMNQTLEKKRAEIKTLEERKKTLTTENARLEENNRKQGQLNTDLANRVPPQEAQTAYSKVPGIENATPLVYVQYPEPSQRAAVDKIIAGLKKDGYIVPRAEKRKGPQKATQIRYFRREDSERAAQLAKTLQEMQVNDKIVTQLTASPKPNLKHLELWFSPNFR